MNRTQVDHYISSDVGRHPRSRSVDNPVLRLSRAAFWFLVTSASLLTLTNCGGNSAPSGNASGVNSGDGSSPTGASALAVSPSTASVLLGDSISFTAQNKSGSAVSVNWRVGSVPGGDEALGTIGADGHYTAPSILPSAQNLQISATAKNDSAESGSAEVTLTSGISIDITPLGIDLAFGASQNFTAQIHSDGHPSPAVKWSVNGVAGGNSSLGTIGPATAGEPNTSAAVYTAPASSSGENSVEVVVTSVADPSKSSKAVVSLKCADALSPTRAAVALSQTLNFTATWCAAGEGGASDDQTSWSVDAITGGNPVLGHIVPTGTNTAAYTAPADLPASPTITIGAARDGKSLSATVTLESAVTVSIAPSSAVVALGGRVTLTPTVTATTDTSLTWAVNGLTAGNQHLGQICAAGSNPCLPITTAISGPVDYVPPSVIPSPATVTISATSHADPSRTASASLTVIPSGTSEISVTVAPAYTFIAPSGTQQFISTVTGSNNSAVLWSIKTTTSGCAGSACGRISSGGLYQAPSVAPSPNTIVVQAISEADPTVAGTATVSVTTGPNIQQILPSSVMAGVASSFTLAVIGSGFASSTGSPASTIFVNGNARSTVCQTTLRCTITLQPADVSAAGAFNVQIENPGATGASSNVVPFVVVPFTLNEAVITLTVSQPESDANNITVFEPTTAGVTAAQINVDYAGPITAGATCNFDSSPITLVRPSSGSATSSICVHGNALDPSFFYEFSGTATPDISIASASLASIFPDLVQLNLTITTATTPGVRSLFITTPNNDKAVATGLLEVQ